MQLLKKLLLLFTQKLTRNKSLSATSSSDIHYQDLTPVLIENDNTYSEALLWALKNENIKNLAITGPYGSGKSSILKTFQRQYQKAYRFLPISLASFNEEPEKGTPINQLIELSILQQIFYHEKQKNIPYSRFKKIQNLKKTNLVVHSIFWLIWVGSIVLLFEQTKVKSLAVMLGFSISNKIYSILGYFSLFILVGGLLYIIRYLLGIIFNLKLNKLNLKGEVDLSKDDSSILNKHLDEILYFFEATDFNTVIIEDLDRFKEPEIFTKLRELNLLINNSKQVNRRVVFIYALKDDMFKDKSRAKFFDFIIPVIPVINASNSGEILLQRLSYINEGISDDNKLTEQFVTDISLFIEDMRMLKNICNEFLIYRNKLSGINLKYDRLMAVIIYKNLYPGDFADLHFSKGMVYAAFSDKGIIVQQHLEGIDKKITELEKNIIATGNVLQKSIKELRALYIEAFLQKMPRAIAFEFDGNKRTFNETKEDNFFAKLKGASNIRYEYLQYSYTETVNSNISFNQLEQIVDPNQTYNERETLVKRKLDGEAINGMQNEIAELNKKKSEIKAWSLKKILADNIDLPKKYQPLKDEKLLFYLVQEGYINEDYYDYISFFYEGRFSTEDKKFLLANRHREPLDFNFPLKKISNVINNLKIEEYGREAIFNHSLINYLIINFSKYSVQFNAFVAQLSNKSKTSLLYIDNYISTEKHTVFFIQSICHNWPDFWNCIEDQKNYSKDQKDNYLKLILQHAGLPEIVKLNKDNKITEYIISIPDFIFWGDTQKEILKIQSVIKQLKIKFTLLAKPSGSSPLFDFIYNGNYYQINSEMVKLVSEVKGNETTKQNIEELDSANYTFIQKSTCANLIDYIEDNIDEYVSRIFLLPANISETESSIIAILNHAGVSDENKNVIIQEKDFKISDIQELDKKIWSILIEYSRVKPVWENIILYTVVSEEINESSLSFLNEKENYEALSKLVIPHSTEAEKDSARRISEQLLLCNDLSEEAYSALCKSIPFSYNQLAFEGLKAGKVIRLLNNNKLNLTKSNFEILKNKFSPLHINLIEKKISRFMESFADYPIDASDIGKIIASSIITGAQKVSIIHQTDESIIISKNSLATPVSQLLAANTTKKIDLSFLRYLFQHSSSTEARVKILNQEIDTLGEDNITELLGYLEESYAEIAVKGKHPLIVNHSDNKMLVENLQRKNYISSYTEKEGMIRIYTKTK